MALDLTKTIDVTGLREQTIDNHRLDGSRNCLNLKDCHGIRVTRPRYLNAGGYPITLERCTGISIEDGDVIGAGVTEVEWQAHGADCMMIQSCSDLSVKRMRFGAAAHDSATILDTKRFEFIDSQFGVIPKEYTLTRRTNGASFFTVKRGCEDGRWVRCRFVDAPDGQHSVAKHAVHHAALQLSGKRLQVLQCVIERCAKGIMFSSDDDPAYMQVAQDILIEDLVVTGCATYPGPKGQLGIALEYQQGGPAGSISRIIVRRGKIWSAQQLLHFALPGVGADLAGNRFEECEWGAGGFFLSAGSVTTAEQLNAKYPSVCKGNRTISTAPTPGPGPGPGPPPPPPPAGGVLESVTPNPCKPGDLLIYRGEGIPGSTGYAVVKAASSLTGQRLKALTWSPTEVRAKAPADILTGPAWLTYTGGPSNRVELKVASEPTPTPSPPPPPTSPGAEEVLILTNQERARVGVSPLAMEPRLRAAAQKHSEWMAANNTMSHTGANGSSPFDRMKAEGYAFRTAGENVAAGFTAPVAVVTAWMASPGHRTNMLNPGFTDIGVGIATSGRTYWTQCFGAGAGTPAPTPIGPVIDRVEPVQAKAGDTVTLYGQRLGSAVGRVTFAGGAAGEVVYWTDTNISVRVPAAAATGLVTAHLADGQAAGTYLYITPPVTGDEPIVMQLTPATGPVGALIRCTGYRFGAIPGRVELSGKPMPLLYWSGSGYYALVSIPDGAKSGIVALVTQDGKRSNELPLEVT